MMDSFWWAWMVAGWVMQVYFTIRMMISGDRVIQTILEMNESLLNTLCTLTQGEEQEKYRAIRRETQAMLERAKKPRIPWFPKML